MMTPCTTEKSKRDYILLKDALDNGNQKAYAELLKIYRDPIYFMLLKMMNNPYDAEDLTIEAFGKAFKNLDKYTTDYAFSTWLFKIAINNCIDYMRRKNSSPQCVDQDLCNYENSLQDIANPYRQETPEDNYMEKQRVKIMHLAVDQLRPKYKMLIELRYYEELSYEEIAKELNISMSNVKIQLYRAKDMLAAIMENMKYAI
ncbi:MAG: sigma-70 family RNA polymerase sigma factor [Bacteroidales bacterium]